MIEYIEEQRRKYPKFTEVIRFLIIGVISTLIDLLIMGLVMYLPNREILNNSFINVYASGVHINVWWIVLGTATGFLISLVFSYLLSILYVYQGNNLNAKTKKGFIFFSIISVISLFIQTFGIYIGYNILNFNEWIVKLVLILIVLVFNFIARKILVFKDIKYSKPQLSTKLNLKDVVFNLCFIVSAFGLELLLFNTVNEITNVWLNVFQWVLVAGTFIVLFFLVFIFEKKLILNFLLKIKFFNVFFSFLIIFFANFLIFNFFKADYLSFIIYFFLSIFAQFFAVSNLLGFIVLQFKLLFESFSKKTKTVFIFCLLAFVLITSIFYILSLSNSNLFFNFNFYDINNYNNNYLHLLFSLCYLPFSVIPFFISKVFYFIPNVYSLIYCYVLVFVIALSVLKICKIVKENNCLIEVLFLIFVTTLLNLIIGENRFDIFIINLFYLITIIQLTKQDNFYRYYIFSFFAGLSVVNLLLMPYIISKKCVSFKQKITEIIDFICLFLIIILILGQANNLLNFLGIIF